MVFKKRHTARRVARFGRRMYARHTTSAGKIPIIKYGMALGYGAFRQDIQGFLPQISFLGNASDEAILGTIGVLAERGVFGKKPYIRQAGDVIATTEMVRIGYMLRNGMITSGNNSTGTGFS